MLQQARCLIDTWLLSTCLIKFPRSHSRSTLVPESFPLTSVKLISLATCTQLHTLTHSHTPTHTRAVTSQVADVLTLCTLIASDLAEGRSCCKREEQRGEHTLYPFPPFPFFPYPLQRHLSLWSVAAEIINNFLLICNCFWPCSHRTPL